MKNLFFFFLIFITQFAYSQQVKVLSVEKLNTDKSGFYYPRFSPAGDYLVMSKSNYSGLYKYDLASKSTKILNEDNGAGYDVQISSDGNTLLYKKTELINRLRHTSLVSQSLLTDEKKVIVSPTRESVKGQISGQSISYAKGKKMIKPNSNVNQQIVTTEDKKMVIYRNGVRKETLPNGANESYFWCSISPNGKNLVYTVAGKGTYTCTIDGKNVKKLGKLGAPAWAGNKYVVGMDDIDDGEKLISSKIVIKSIDGTFSKDLDVQGVKAMYPCATTDGAKVAFNSDNGEIYIMSIELK